MRLPLTTSFAVAANISFACCGLGYFLHVCYGHESFPCMPATTMYIYGHGYFPVRLFANNFLALLPRPRIICLTLPLLQCVCGIWATSLPFVVSAAGDRAAFRCVVLPKPGSPNERWSPSLPCVGSAVTEGYAHTDTACWRCRVYSALRCNVSRPRTSLSRVGTGPAPFATTLVPYTPPRCHVSGPRTPPSCVSAVRPVPLPLVYTAHSAATCGCRALH